MAGLFGFPGVIAEIIDEYTPRLRLREWINKGRILNEASLWLNPAALDAGFIDPKSIRKFKKYAAGNPALIDYIEADIGHYIHESAAWANPLLYKHLIAKKEELSYIDYEYLKMNTNIKVINHIIKEIWYPASSFPNFFGHTFYPTDFGCSRLDIQDELKKMFDIHKNNYHQGKNIRHFCACASIVDNQNEWAINYIKEGIRSFDDKMWTSFAQNPSIFEPYRCERYMKLLMSAEL